MLISQRYQQNSGVTWWRNSGAAASGSHGILVIDSVTTLESVQIGGTEGRIVVNDSLTTSENISVNVAIFILQPDSAHEDPFVHEFVALNLLVFSIVSDSTTLADTVNIGEVNSIGVNDATTTSESVFVNLVGQPIVSDSVTTSEFVTIFSPILSTQVNDSITTGEFISVNLLLQISVNDSITTSEFVNIENVNQSTVSDSVTTSENLHIELGIFIAQPDAVREDTKITEFIKLQLVSGVFVFDSTTISDLGSWTFILQPNVIDSISTLEFIAAQLLDFINANDFVSVTEAVTIINNQLGGISVFDLVFTSENVKISGTLGNISVNDSTATSEFVSINVLPQPNVFDFISISENVKISLANLGDIVVSDSVSMFDTVSNSGLSISLISFDSTTTLEFSSVLVNDAIHILINVSDSLSINESILIITPMGSSLLPNQPRSEDYLFKSRGIGEF